MAFGSSGNDIQVKVTLDTQDAERQAQGLKSDVEGSLKGIASAATNPINALKDLAKNLTQGNSAAGSMATGVGNLGSKLAGFAPQATAAAIAVGGLTLAWKGLVSVAADGDRFGDVSEAFEANAEKAGILADELRGNLSRAFNDAASDADLMVAANKAFAAGIDPAVFDDLAAAAKRYADATGGDAKQALDELIQGVNSGREAMLKKFGVIENGVLVLDKFTDAEYKSAQANRNVTDVYENFTATLANVYSEISRAVNESELLKVATQAVASVVGGLAQALGGAVSWFVEFTNKGVRVLRQELELLSSGFSVLGELISQARSGELPSLAKAQAVVAKQMAETAKQGEKASKVFVKLKKDVGDVATETKKLGDPMGDAIEDLKAFERTINDMLGVEDFQLDPQVKALRDKVRSAFEMGQGDKAKILTALKANVIGPYLQEVEAIPEEFKKRLGELQDAIRKVSSEQKDVLSGDGGASKIEPSTIFGIDAGGLSREMAGTIENALSGAFNGVAQAIVNGDGRQAAQSIGIAVGSVIGTAIGAYFGGAAGAAAGGSIGATFGSYMDKIGDALFGGDGAGTKARKKADRYFADIFDEHRLSVVINGQIARIRDLVFAGQGAAGGLMGGLETSLEAGPAGVVTAIGAGVGGYLDKNNPKFDGTHFDDAFEQLPGKAQAAFQAVGTSYEEFLGLSDDISGQIGAILVNNIGGSLENLQVLVQTVGSSFQELGDEIIEAFYDGTLSIEEAAARLEGLQELFTPGIPEAIGDIEQAVSNLQIALADGKGSRILIDSLRDIGAEALEIGYKDFPQAADRIAAAFGFSANQVAAFFAAMKTIGISNMTELVNASTAQLIELAKAINQITQGQAVTATNVVDPTAGSTAPGNFTPGSYGAPASAGGGGGRPSGGGSSSAASSAKQKAEQAKREREQQFQQIYKLLTASKAYDDILESITSHTVANSEANKQIAELYSQITKAQKELTAADEAYQKALKNDNKKQLADLADRLDKARKNFNDLTKTASEAQKSLKFDLSNVTPLVQDLNQLGTLSRAVGVNLDGVADTLVAGFLRGKISLQEFNAEMDKSTKLLGDGIPGAVGDLDQAMKNLVEGGTEGGLFSVDALQDVFSEFQEKFKEQSSATRKSRGDALLQEFNKARDEYQQVINSGSSAAESQAARDTFDAAKKALADFESTADKAGFEDLRSEMEKIWDPKQVEIFFKAIADTGKTDLADFGSLTNEEATKMLADLQKLGFGLGETSDRVKEINDQIDKSITDANGGKDVLQESLNVIQKFNEALGLLPGSADSGSNALQALNSGFDDIIEKIARLDGRTFENDVVFNIRTNGSSGEKALVDVLFGDGSGTSDAPGGTGPGLTSRQQTRLKFLQSKAKKTTLSKAEQRQLKDLLAAAGAA